MRAVIIGNSGAGKAWLAKRLAGAWRLDSTDLDLIHWEDGGANVRRKPDASIDAVRRVAATPAWVIEGVYGWLAAEALPRATMLIWLDLPVDACVAALRRRRSRRGGDADSLTALVRWAGEYEERQTSSSRAGHERLFTSFAGSRHRLASRSAVSGYARSLPSPEPDRFAAVGSGR